MGESTALRYRVVRDAYTYWHFSRTRGKETLQPFEQPLKIAVIGSPAAHYLGLGAGWSVLLGAAFIVAWELASIIAGRVDHKWGVIRGQQQLTNEQDEVKMRTLHVLEELLAEVQALRDHARSGAGLAPGSEAGASQLGELASLSSGTPPAL